MTDMSDSPDPLADDEELWFSEVAERREAHERFDAELGEQLLRGFLAAGRTDLVRGLVRDLFRAGFVMHDCRGGFGAKDQGGVCLVPLTEPEGVGVAWAQHDVMYDDDAYAVHTDVQETMNYALADTLRCLGWQVESFGVASAHRVTGKAS